MAHLDLANLRTCLLDDTQLAAVALTRSFAGNLPVSSGHLVVCDPLVQTEAPALADYTAPAGLHPVEIIVHSGRPALAVVWFKPRRTLTACALHWQMARWTTQDLTGLDENSFIGYPVDAGIGCFMDTATQQALLALIDQGNETWSDALIDHDGLDEGAEYRPWGEDSPHGLVVFTSGWGDGIYPTYWALDTSGIPVALVTDFLCIQGGDGRDEREIADQAYRDSLAPDEAEALAQLVAAVERDDVDALRSLLKDAPQRANQIEPECGGTAVFEAIRLDRPQALRVLLQGAALPAMPASLYTSKVTSYLDYARFLRKPRSPELMAVLEEPVTATPATVVKARPGFWARLFGRR
ncbi:MAG: DUF4241 domain-containing protein [Stenotrophomonas maltophilia]|uniref:DUF4241 domain-containing protein n=1 Tax=Stenotrophomonas TaxID=40323 RepID=UPI0013106FA7|nr:MULTISPECIES: DUF4241 domain-containing protein [Stenotrophomonas]MBS4800379.1 DUF4241 domain-containing protein [Stenotrophomonas maltophilia]MDG9988321.1 DUF4241 domain-containing protein [Stenotrophomonas sp. GD04024]